MENKIQKTVFYRAQFVLKIINAYLRANPRTLAASEKSLQPLGNFSCVSLPFFAYHWLLTFPSASCVCLLGNLWPKLLR